MQEIRGIYYVPKDDGDLRLAINYANQALEFAGDTKGSEIKVYDDSLEALIKERHEREKSWGGNCNPIWGSRLWIL